MNWAQLDSNELEKWLNDTSGKITDTDRQEIENILKQRKVDDSVRRYEDAIANRQVPDDSAYKAYKNRQAQTAANQKAFEDSFVKNQQALTTAQATAEEDRQRQQTEADMRSMFDEVRDNTNKATAEKNRAWTNQFMNGTFGEGLPKPDVSKDTISGKLDYAGANIDTSRPFLNDEQKKVMGAMPTNDDTLRTARDWYNVPDEILNQLVDSGDEDAKAEKARRDQNNFFAGKIAGFNKSAKRSMSGLAPALSGYAARRLAGRDPMGRSAGLERQAEMHEQESTDYQKLAQQQAQIANRDYRAEAEKNAAANAAIQNAQAVANMGNASAGAAALNRNVQAADYNTMMQRQDTMRKEAMDARQRAYDAQQVAQQERTDAKGYDYVTKNAAATNAMMQSLSQGPLGNTVNANVTKSENKENQEDNNHNPSEAISRLFSEKYFNGLSDEELAALAQRLEDARKGKKVANPEDKEEQDVNTK